MGVSGLTVSFAPFCQQQFEDADEAFGSSQVERAVTHLTTRVHIGPKLQQQLCHLCGGEKKQTNSTVENFLFLEHFFFSPSWLKVKTLKEAVYLLVAVI